jgi:multicomponent Na+:H+ antiporter subunit G
MTVKMIICAVLIAAGLLFMFASLIGIAKLPDFFTRLHAQGIGDTLGAFLILAGMMAASWGGLLPVKIFLIFIVLVLTNPIGTNLMMIAAINKEDYLGYRSMMTGESPETVGSDIEISVPAAADEEPEAEQASEEESKTPAAAEAEETSEPEPEKPAEVVSEPEKAPAEKGKSRNRRRRNKSSNKTKADNSKTDKAKEENSGDKKNPKKENSGDKKTPKKRKPKPSMRMNKEELIRAAENRGIKVPEKATKKEILDLIYAEKSGK